MSRTRVKKRKAQPVVSPEARERKAARAAKLKMRSALAWAARARVRAEAAEAEAQMKAAFQVRDVWEEAKARVIARAALARKEAEDAETRWRATDAVWRACVVFEGGAK